ncbi:MAG: DUF5765 domain-containing protein [Alphaproteobacteria bacterium]
MCWSGEASAALTVLGLACTANAIRKRESILLWAPLFYFTLMEALQAYTYTVIDGCGMPANEIATVLGYLHITFQPFFINMFSLYFIDKRVARKIAPYAYALCFAAAIIMLLKLYPFNWAPPCAEGIRPMCGRDICSFAGNWHIAWRLPINDLMSSLPSYLIVGFIMPLLYGSWRFTLFHFLFGPFLAWLSTDNINEWPAIWCLLSIDLILIIMNSRLRRAMFVSRWPLWQQVRKLRIPPPEKS